MSPVIQLMWFLAQVFGNLGSWAWDNIAGTFPGISVPTGKYQALWGALYPLWNMSLTTTPPPKKNWAVWVTTFKYLGSFAICSLLHEPFIWIWLPSRPFPLWPTLYGQLLTQCSHAFIWLPTVCRINRIHEVWCSHRHKGVLVSILLLACSPCDLGQDISLYISHFSGSPQTPLPFTVKPHEGINIRSSPFSLRIQLTTQSNLAFVSIWPLEFLLSRTLMTSVLWNQRTFFFPPEIRFLEIKQNKQQQKRTL